MQQIWKTPLKIAGRAERRDNAGMAQRMVDVERLTPDEQLDLIGQREEIDRRSNELDEDVRAGRPLGIPWEDVFRQLRSRRP